MSHGRFWLSKRARNEFRATQEPKTRQPRSPRVHARRPDRWVAIRTSPLPAEPRTIDPSRSSFLRACESSIARHAEDQDREHEKRTQIDRDPEETAWAQNANAVLERRPQFDRARRRINRVIDKRERCLLRSVVGKRGPVGRSRRGHLRLGAGNRQRFDGALDAHRPFALIPASLAGVTSRNRDGNVGAVFCGRLPRADTARPVRARFQPAT
jgi:hypothetical protein